MIIKFVVTTVKSENTREYQSGTSEPKIISSFVCHFVHEDILYTKSAQTKCLLTQKYILKDASKISVHTRIFIDESMFISCIPAFFVVGLSVSQILNYTNKAHF